VHILWDRVPCGILLVKAASASTLAQRYPSKGGGGHGLSTQRSMMKGSRRIFKYSTQVAHIDSSGTTKERQWKEVNSPQLSKLRFYICEFNIKRFHEISSFNIDH
jgi:hypothetical protein